jgi:hypothetical protein
MKLMKKLMNSALSSLSASARSWTLPPSEMLGTPIETTSRVIAIAKRPSLKVRARSNSTLCRS